MSAHLSAEQLSWLVRGEGDLTRWEPHVDVCAECAAAVEREAHLELAVQALFREQRCGTSAIPHFKVLPEDAPVPTSRAWRALPEEAPVPTSRAWRALAGGAVLALVLAVLPAMAPEPTAGTDVPCAGVAVDGGALLMMAAVGDVETPSAHGTP